MEGLAPQLAGKKIGYSFKDHIDILCEQGLPPQLAGKKNGDLD